VSTPTNDRASQRATPASTESPTAFVAGPLANLRVLELADEKGQFCGKLMADLGADVITIEPPGGAATRRVGPFLDDNPDPNASLSFWHYNTSKRGITLDIETPEGRDIFRQLADGADVILEATKPGYLAALALDYPRLSVSNPGLIWCALTPFGQTGPWAAFDTSDLLHMAAGGQMASCGYDEAQVPGGMPIAPGGGNAWHMGGHFAYISIAAALVFRSVSGQGQYIDASIHDACALTTEAAIPAFIYRNDTLLRQTGRHHSPTPTLRTQFESADGRYVTALVANQLSPQYVRTLASLLDDYGMAEDLRDPKYEDPAVVEASAEHIIEGVIARFIASQDAEQVYHAAQARGLTWGAVRPAEALVEDAHLHDREFWKQVKHPELGRSFTYPGEPAIYNGSPWRIACRAPLVGEHNAAVFCEELGMRTDALVVLAENGVI
jgi:crotonobetainyl-CoA:carnitine CoA-transferase CaiB-like acyl-CoA transferase